MCIIYPNLSCRSPMMWVVTRETELKTLCQWLCLHMHKCRDSVHMCVHMFVLADARTHTLSEIQLYFSSTHCDLFVKGDSSVISSQRSKVKGCVWTLCSLHKKNHFSLFKDRNAIQMWCDVKLKVPSICGLAPFGHATMPDHMWAMSFCGHGWCAVCVCV